MKKQIATFVTLVNLLFGCLAIWSALHGLLAEACLMIIVAAVFDFFDGMVARALGIQSEMGKQLDSLSDVVSFGVAPAMIIAYLLELTFSDRQLMFTVTEKILFIAPCFINPMFAALRLAKFN